MKAVRQLIDYFRAAGRLTPDDLDHLLRTGVIDIETRYQESIDEWSQDYYRSSPEDDVDPTSDTTAGEGTAHRAGRHGASSPRFHSLDADQLCEWIGARQSEWSVQVAALEDLARRLDGTEASLTIVRTATDDALDRASRGLELGPLWDAATFWGYLDILHEHAATGSVANAYRTVVMASQSVRGSKHAWLLGRPQVRWVYNLRVAQDRVLSALGRYPTEQPTAFAHALRVTRRALLPFVLLHMARSGGGSPVAAVRDDAGPPAEAPDIPFGDCVPTLSVLSTEWTQAWEIAARMDGAPVARLLMQYLRVEGLFRETDWPWEGYGLMTFRDLGLHCPVTWTFMRHGSE